MRERLAVRRHRIGNRGITPARAGKTRFGISSVGLTQDHPRSCGKDRPAPDAMPIVAGSPPLVRERRWRLASDETDDGITPARAGKTEFPATARTNHRDHPRSCGKDRKWFVSRQRTSGSPPLVRERPFLAALRCSGCRITPARAGKTPREAPLFYADGDHPRSCGKDVNKLLEEKRNKGSPPLVRERLVNPA